MNDPVHLLRPAIEHLSPLLEKHGVSALFVPIFVEGFGLPAPGQTLLIAAALLADGGRLRLGAVFGFAAVATFAGTLVGYLAGRVLGRGFLTGRARQGALLTRVEILVERHGMAFLIAARFVEGLKQTASIAVGALGLPAARFLLANLVASVCWAGVFSLAPWWIVAHAHRLLALEQEHRVAALGVVMAGLVILLVVLARGRRRPIG